MTTNKFAFEEPEGTLYVEILYADEKSVSRMNGKTDTYHQPEVEVTTHPDMDTKGYVTLRGRQYSISYQVTPRKDPSTNVRTGRLCAWDVTHTPYNGGNRNENGQQLEYDSPVSDKLNVIRDRVLARFAKEHPEWESVSIRLALQGDVNVAAGRVRSAQEALREAEDNHAAAQSRLQGFIAKTGE